VTFSAALSKRLQLFANFILIIVQLITIGALWGMVGSTEDLMSLSQSIYPDSNKLFNSTYVEIIVTPLFAAIMTLVFVVSIGKEFYMDNRLKRLLINTILVCVLAGLIGIAASIIYSPVLSSS
jgi:uncharacterized membrane protein